jgi:hypothetical protein
MGETKISRWLALGCGWMSGAVAAAAVAYVAGGVGVLSALAALAVGFSVTMGLLRYR